MAPTGLWELSLGVYRAIPADTQMQARGFWHMPANIPVDLGVWIKSSKTKQEESLPGAVNTGECLGPGVSMGYPAFALRCVFYQLARAWGIWW